LIVYLAGVMLTELSWNFWSFAAFRAVTGLGIGGEYAAINSAIDELIPASYRGRVDLIVNGSFWLGAALGSGASLFFLDPKRFAMSAGVSALPSVASSASALDRSFRWRGGRWRSRYSTRSAPRSEAPSARRCSAI
jgi:MFS family permease